MTPAYCIQKQPPKTAKPSYSAYIETYLLQVPMSNLKEGKVKSQNLVGSSLGENERKSKEGGDGKKKFGPAYIGGENGQSVLIRELRERVGS